MNDLLTKMDNNRLWMRLQFWALLIVLLALCGCYTPKDAVKGVNKAQSIFPEEVARLCGIYYPPVKETWDSTGFIMGEEPVQDEEVQIDCYSLLEQLLPDISAELKQRITDSMKALLKPTVPCPPCKPRVDTFYKYERKVVENTAAKYALEDEVKKLTAEKIKETESKEDWRMWAIAGWVIIAAFAVWKFIKWKFLKK